VSNKQAIWKIKLTPVLALNYRKQLVQEALSQADLMNGGIDTPRKFPIAPQLAALLEIASLQPDARLSEWLRLTLDQIAGKGLRDHVEEVFFVTPSIRIGIRHTLRKCCTTMPSWQ